MKARTALVIAVGLALAAGVARAAGDTIAAAPELPVGQQQFNGRSGVDFWRLTLGAGDRVTLNFGSTDGGMVTACLLRPNVTDYTLAAAKCVAYASTEGKKQLVSIANPAGRWTVAAGDSSDCVRWWTGTVHPQCSGDVAYELTAYVQKYTSTTLAAPGSAQRNQRLKLRGKVAGVPGGRILVDWRSNGRWIRFKTLPIAKDGAFVIKITFPGRGRYQLRATYPGDPTHRESSRVVTIQVT